MKMRLILVGVFFSMPVIAAHGIDVYGLNAKESNAFLQRYEPRIADITNQLHDGILKDTDGFLGSQAGEAIIKKRNALIETVKKAEGYLYVNFETVYYSGNDYYTTVEIIKPSQKERLKYITGKSAPKNYPKIHDVIDKMDEYREIGYKLLMAGKIQPKHNTCPVYHCSMGFDHPQLKPYLALFNQAVVHEKQFILNTLNQDPNPDRRGAAAYLIGHFDDPQEIISVLLPHVKDPDEVVRNNVIRVISLTALKAKITTLDPAPFVALLDSPISSDRNKSLFLLAQLAQSKRGKTYLIHHADIPLLTILAMKQPNQQEFAYMIMKELSGQDFGEHNLRAWQAWMKKAKLA